MDAPFTKTSTQPAGRLRLRKELVRLRQAQHPAVVVVYDFEDGEDQTRLELAHGGVTTIAESPPDHPELALAFIAAAAGAVGDLHDIGLAHRRLTGDHIIVTPEGHPLLCGFADATMPASDDDRVTDQRALGALVNLLAQSASSAGRHARAAKALRTLAVDVADHDGSMTAATLAARAAKLASRYPAGATPSGTRLAASIGRRFSGVANRASSRAGAAKAVVAVSVAAAVVLVAIVGLAGGPGSTERDADTQTAGSEFSPGPAATLGERSNQSVPSSGRPPDSAVADPVAAAPGEVEMATPAVHFQAGGAMFAVGQTGDEVHVGDWTCTGEPAAVLWRPDTGDLYVFAALPGPGVESTGAWAARAPGGSLILPDAGAACPLLAIREANGATRTVELP